MFGKDAVDAEARYPRMTERDEALALEVLGAKLGLAGEAVPVGQHRDVGRLGHVFDDDGRMLERRFGKAEIALAMDDRRQDGV